MVWLFVLPAFKSAMTWRSRNLRARKVRRFLDVMQPGPTDLVMDLGVGSEGEETGSSTEFWRDNINPLTQFAPTTLRILGVAFDAAELPPGGELLRFIRGDGRRLPFKDNSVDFVFSNAVIEHVGTREDQRRFVSECLRVAGKGVFITTPNRLFLLDPHVQVPLVHLLPRKLYDLAVRWLQKPHLSSIEYLNALSSNELKTCFPEGSGCCVEGIGIPIIPETLVAWTLKQDPSP